MKPGDLARVMPHGVDLVVLVQTVDKVAHGDKPTIDLGDLWRVYSPEKRDLRMMHEIYLEVVPSA